MSTIEHVAKRLTELCAKGEHHQAMIELYADNARHVEAMEMPGNPPARIMQGKPALIAMSEHFGKTNTIHACSCSDPLINGDQFVCQMSLDMTAGEGPMAGQRVTMAETCLYTVANGKITEAKFFYPTCA